MKARIIEKLYNWNLTSIVGTVIFLAILSYGSYYISNFRDNLRNAKSEKFEGHTFGHIISIEPITRMNQSKWKGTEIYTDEYQIEFTYSIKGQRYTNIDFIQLIEKNKYLLKSMLDRGSTDTFDILYDLNNPEKSILVTEDYPLD